MAKAFRTTLPGLKLLLRDVLVSVVQQLKHLLAASSVWAIASLAPPPPAPGAAIRSKRTQRRNERRDYVRRRVRAVRRCILAETVLLLLIRVRWYGAGELEDKVAVGGATRTALVVLEIVVHGGAWGGFGHVGACMGLIEMMMVGTRLGSTHKGFVLFG
ncbi:hypothetical protein B0H16DRAFT_1450704 [Mycena metata]|uniref:Uncharacterized protein n=1 Tax=Mycena metata TaxID=1033252 RepID=A0AAD7JXD1_9AGAR|nr:hypothetical protein B0H16DRAFT_1450704 [Mycena metata]